MSATTSSTASTTSCQGMRRVVALTSCFCGSSVRRVSRSHGSTMRNKSIGTEMFFSSVGASFSNRASSALRIWRSTSIETTDPARPRYRLDPRSDVHSSAVDVAAAMDHVADVNADSHLDLAFRRRIGIAFGQSALNCHGALSRFQCALKLDQESVPDRFNLDAVELWTDFPKQPAMFLQQFLGKLFVALAQRAVADHVSKHDGGKPTLFS